jgi:type IV pilus assembly protein PilB
VARVRIGELLVSQGQIDSIQLESALAHQRRWGGRIGRAIVQLGFLPEPRLLEAVGAQLGVPFVEIGDRQVDPRVLALLPAKLVRTRKVVPLARLSESRRGPIVVALSDASDLRVIDEIAFATGMQVKPVLAAEDDIERAIARLYDGRTLPPAGVGFHARKDAIELPDDTSPLTMLRKNQGNGSLH